MQTYLLSVYQPDGGEPPAPEILDGIMAELNTINDDMRAAGAWVFSGGLDSPSTATVLQAQDGDVVMTDGPFAELKEYLGGFTILEAEDLDGALAWGQRIAKAIGLPIEVRPFFDVR
jgi:hypothetical protein